MLELPGGRMWGRVGSPDMRADRLVTHAGEMWAENERVQLHRICVAAELVAVRLRAVFRGTAIW